MTLIVFAWSRSLMAIDIELQVVTSTKWWSVIEDTSTCSHNYIPHGCFIITLGDKAHHYIQGPKKCTHIYPSTYCLHKLSLL